MNRKNHVEIVLSLCLIFLSVNLAYTLRHTPNGAYRSSEGDTKKTGANNRKGSGAKNKNRYSSARERSKLIWGKILKRLMKYYSEETSKYDKEKIADKIQEIKRRIHHAILIFNRKIPHNSYFYSKNKNNDVSSEMLIAIGDIFDSETPQILYTGLSPSQSNIFDIRFLTNYLTLGSDFLDWLFRRAPADEANCKYHFPKIPADENGCSFIMFNILPDFVPITGSCEYVNSITTWPLFLFYYLTNDIICRLIAFSPGFAGFSIFLYEGGTIELPSTILFCLLIRIYWGVLLGIIIINTIILLILMALSLCCAGLCTGCLYNEDRYEKLERKFEEFKSETNKSISNNNAIINTRLRKNSKNINEIVISMSRIENF